MCKRLLIAGPQKASWGPIRNLETSIRALIATLCFATEGEMNYSIV